MKKALKTMICIIIAAVLIVGYYYYLHHRSDDASTEEQTEELSEVDDILTTDLEKDYPPSPREVVKLYDRILQCYYSGDCTEEQVKGLSDMQWNLLDPELQEVNPQDSFYSSVEADIEQAAAMERTIVTIDVCSSVDVEYKTVQGKDCAVVGATYFMKEGSSYEKTNQNYALRRDDNDHWRIIAFDYADQEVSTGND